ncbi:MAG: kynureninase [Woeseiaceae bacterium]|jgi:kynureninase
MAGSATTGLRVVQYEATRKFARALDDADEIRQFRDQFIFPLQRDDRRNIYLCGNSLGLQAKRAVRFVEEELEDWGRLGVEGHFRARRPWMPYHRNATQGFAYLTGSQADEVVAMNTLTVNLHLMMTTFYRPDSKRHKIVIESTAFPSDRFAAMSQLKLHGFDPDEALIEWRPQDDDQLHIDDLVHILDTHADEVALLLLPGVQYYNGQVLDMAGLCKLASDRGCVIGLDLAHAVGNVPLALHEWGPDFAAWCTYKYLNGGPGAVGGAFVHSRHLNNNDTQQLLGWWGHEETTRFRMAPTFTPAKGIELWQLSNPPILSLAPVLASLQLFEEAGIGNLRAKSLHLTGFLDFLLRTNFSGSVESITPADARGCQLSLVIRDKRLKAKAVFDSLEKLNVTSDWREPNVIRVAPVPLYNSFEDVYEFSARLRLAIDENE